MLRRYFNASVDKNIGSSSLCNSHYLLLVSISYILFMKQFISVQYICISIDSPYRYTCISWCIPGDDGCAVIYGGVFIEISIIVGFENIGL